MYRTASSIVLEIRGSKAERSYYSSYVQPLFEEVTGVPATRTKRKYVGGYVVGIRCCRKEAYQLFHRVLGFPVGEKCLLVRAPGLILENHSLHADYIRGIFDTDGSIYLRQAGRKRSYRQPVICISSSSKMHRQQIHITLRKLGFRCWLERDSIRMAGWSTARRFFETVKPHNPIHIRRFDRFFLGRHRRKDYASAIL